MKAKRTSYIFVGFVSVAALIFYISQILVALIVLPLNPFSKTKIYIEVEPRSSIKTIAKSLKSKNLINSELIFEIYSKLGPAHGQLVPGYYELSAQKSISSIVSDMHAGNTAVKKVTFPEGITNKEVTARFVSSGLGTKEQFEESLKDNYNFSFLTNNPSQSLEGFLFPDTYIMSANATAHELIEEMLNNFQSKTAPYKQAFDNHPDKLNLYQIVTLASIVDAEAITKEDRQMVAGVMINRLKKNMKLQSDITVNYATGHKNTLPEDTKVDSPYNTYKSNGLPPTPVNNPGLDSIEAVLFYTPNDYLFFIADKNGKIHYAKTLEEHNQNIDRYLN